MGARPVSANEVAEAVRAHPRVSAVGGGTKLPLVGAGERIELTEVSGLTEYEASEYTFTARAGTSVQEVEGALEEKGQYLPFDPLYAESGATLGGTVAAGVSGPGRFRYGGLRDFLIGVQFVDGSGELVRSGGKVVKNAAGFDLPKFLVGSLGRFGILTELSFKVFPAPVETATLQVQCPDHLAAVERLAMISSSRWEADALDYDLENQCITLRLGGPGKALDLLCKEIDSHWSGEVRRLEQDAAVRYWRDLGKNGSPADAAGRLVKIPMSLSRFGALQGQLESRGVGTGRLSSGGAGWWVRVEDDRMESLDTTLKEAGFEGLVVSGKPWSSPWIGRRDRPAIFSAVKKALDPEGRFPEI